MPEEPLLSLGQLQHWMQQMLMGADASAAGTDSLPKPEEIINTSAKLSALHHLAIYRQSYHARLRECMYSQFSALTYALGKELFKSFADQYLEAYPSESYTLNDLGRRFPRFLEQSRTTFGVDEAEEWPFFLIELAQFEFDLSLIFDEPTEQSEFVPFEIGPDEVVKVCPLFHHRFPVCQYYLDFTQAKAPELPFPKENFWAVTRLNYRLKLHELSVIEYLFLNSLKMGRTVNETKKYLIANHRLDLSKIEATWNQWQGSFLTKGILTRN